jgi:heptosyltransferase-1
MKVLVVKTSSLGDVIHALPALSDAQAQLPNIQFHWLVEAAFQEIPQWHPAVTRVIPMTWRRWRKNLFFYWKNQELHNFFKQLRQENYDLIIDVQGLFKSALFALIAKGPTVGLDYKSAREPLVSFLYKQRFEATWQQHAVMRNRLLFAKALNYDVPKTPPNYAISENFSNGEINKNNRQLMFIHGTTRDSKKWPEEYWKKLALLCVEKDFSILLPWGNTEERHRADAIATVSSNIRVLAKSTLHELAECMMQTRAIVAVDTGLAHLAAALNIPCLTLYGPTDPNEIGTYGLNQSHLSPEHSQALPDLKPEQVWQKLQKEFLC